MNSTARLMNIYMNIPWSLKMKIRRNHRYRERQRNSTLSVNILPNKTYSYRITSHSWITSSHPIVRVQNPSVSALHYEGSRVLQAGDKTLHCHANSNQLRCSLLSTEQGVLPVSSGLILLEIFKIVLDKFHLTGVNKFCIGYCWKELLCTELNNINK